MGRKNRGDPKCWICGGKGHTQAECPDAGAAVRKCFLCGSEEHMASDCALNQRKASAAEKWPRIERVVSSPRGDAPREGCGARMSVLITTSPVPSNPSTMMLEAVLNSFSRVSGLEECPIVIVCDGYKFTGGKNTWKAGQITEDASVRYAEYKQNLERMLESGRLPPGTKLVILDGHNGQALAVNAGIQHVDTSHVCVHQHDLEFMFDFGLERALDVLEDTSNDVKYIGMPLLVNLHYEGIAWQHHQVRVEEFGCGGLRLVPVIFWYDSTHITSVDQYKSLVFGPTEVYKPGNFVEETFGIRQREDIMAQGMAIHPKYGTHHCLSHSADGSRRPLICHLNGVRFLTPEQRAERGYPADPGVEFFPSRTMVNRKQRRLKGILDAVLGFAGLVDAQVAKVRDILAKELNETRIRTSTPASQSLPSKQS